MRPRSKQAGRDMLLVGSLRNCHPQRTPPTPRHARPGNWSAASPAGDRPLVCHRWPLALLDGSAGVARRDLDLDWDWDWTGRLRSSRCRLAGMLASHTILAAVENGARSWQACDSSVDSDDGWPRKAARHHGPSDAACGTLAVRERPPSSRRGAPGERSVGRSVVCTRSAICGIDERTSYDRSEMTGGWAWKRVGPRAARAPPRGYRARVLHR